MLELASHLAVRTLRQSRGAKKRRCSRPKSLPKNSSQFAQQESPL